jgi:hypothetical protein
VLVIDVTVPADADDEWLMSDTMQRAKALAGATVFVDRGGVEARRFGAATSGTVKWFDSAGQCLYSGGVTVSRGHEGSNIGSDAIDGLLRGGTAPVYGLPPFGCRLCLPPIRESS